MSEDEERALIAGALPGQGPFERAPAELPAGGPKALFCSPTACAWVAGAGRVSAERAGWARLGDHPSRPDVIAHESARVLAYARFGEAVGDPVALVSGWPGTTRRLEGTRRELLGGLDAEVNVPRALGRLVASGRERRGEGALRRRELDRWLGARVSVETQVGPSFGGVHPGWLRAQGERRVCLRCDRARTDGWRAMDLAGLSLDPAIALEVLIEAHGERDAQRAALELALASVWARELVRARDPELVRRTGSSIRAGRREARVPRATSGTSYLSPERSGALVLSARASGTEFRAGLLEERLCGLVRGDAAAPEPAEVRAWVEGPAFLDPAMFCAPGELVGASRARWLLANLDGLAVGGGRLRVRTEPPLRAGRRAPPREDRAERRSRLFSRWDEGVRVDDEGLVGATPEALALHIAHGARGVILDGTAGAGALSIAYARQPEVSKVIAVDLDADRLAMARHNARLYGVERRIDFVHGDIVELAGRVHADLLVLDPPWGGRDYDRERVTLAELGLDVAAVLSRFRGAVVLKLPRSFDPATLPGEPFRLEALADDRGIVKMLVARRPVPS